MQKYERRRNQRFPIERNVRVSFLFKQDYVRLDGIDADISIFDISRTGIGFTSSSELPLDYYFGTRIELDENDFFNCVVRIVRHNGRRGDQGIYGAEFVGLPSFLADKIDEYGRRLDRHGYGSWR